MSNIDFEKVLSNISIKGKKYNLVILYKLLISWKEVAGEFFFTHSVPCNFHYKDSVLYLACDDNIIASELYISQREIISSIYEKMGIRIKKVKTFYNILLFKRFKRIFEKPLFNVKEFKITREEENKIKKLLTRVNDEDLKEALKIYLSVSIIVSKSSLEI